MLDGEKVLVTGVHKSDWCCTIARTDPATTGRHGLTMFLLDPATPGIEVDAPRHRQPLDPVHHALRPRPASEGDAVLGAVGEGWRQLTGALLGERSGAAWLGWATRNLEALLDHCTGTQDRVLRDALADLVTRWFAAARQVERVLALQDAGTPPLVEGAMSKVLATELLQRIARVGAVGARAGGAHRTRLVRRRRCPSGSRTRQVERLHPTLSVGANEIQRTTIATVGLGLPPEPREARDGGNR